MVRTQIQLTEPQFAGLKKLSHDSGQSVAELIRRSVDRLLASGPEDDWEERKRRAIAAIGCLPPGPGDLAENHDFYLLDAYTS